MMKANLLILLTVTVFVLISNSCNGHQVIDKLDLTIEQIISDEDGGHDKPETQDKEHGETNNAEADIMPTASMVQVTPVNDDSINIKFEYISAKETKTIEMQLERVKDLYISNQDNQKVKTYQSVAGNNKIASLTQSEDGSYHGFFELEDGSMIQLATTARFRMLHGEEKFEQLVSNNNLRRNLQDEEYLTQIVGEFEGCGSEKFEQEDNRNLRSRRMLQNLSGLSKAQIQALQEKTDPNPLLNLPHKKCKQRVGSKGLAVPLVFVMDEEFTKKAKSVDKAIEELEAALSIVNQIYDRFFNIKFKVRTIAFAEGAQGNWMDSFKKQCTSNIYSKLLDITNWSHSMQSYTHTYPEFAAPHYHLLSGCSFSYGGAEVRGIAWENTMCNDRYQTGVTGFSNKIFRTLAHELGHSLGASHSFEFGKKETGGIMDYGKGELEGVKGSVLGFRTVKQDMICNKVSSMGSKCFVAKDSVTDDNDDDDEEEEEEEEESNGNEGSDSTEARCRFSRDDCCGHTFTASGQYQGQACVVAKPGKKFGGRVCRPSGWVESRPSQQDKLDDCSNRLI